MRKPKSKKKVLVEDEETPPQYKVGGPVSGISLWSAFGGFPFRYGLEEFGTVTGLPCGSYPERYNPKTSKAIVAGKDRKCEDPVATLVKTLKQRSFRLQGFPLSLQLVAFRAIPLLLDYIPAPLNNLTLMDLEDGTLPQHKSINAIHIRRVEFDPNLVVTPIIPIESQPQPGWGLFLDDAKDDSVLYFEQLIAGQHSFNKHMWHGGVTSEPIIKKPKIRVKKKAATIKQSLQTRQPSAKKQKRISSYFTRSTTQSFTNVQLTEMVIQLSTQVKQLKREMKRRKKRSHARLSSFNKLLSPRKQSNTPPHTPEPSHNHDDAPMETNNLPQTTSPIISQYEAQLHRDSADDHLASSPVIDHCIHTESVHVSPNHNNTCAHPSPDHNVHPSQLSPVYATPPLSHLSLASSHTSDHLIHIQSVHVSPNHINACVHTSPDHNDDSRQVSPVFNQTPQPSQVITHPNDDTYDYDEPPRTPVSVQPPWDELNSVVYDKSDHPNSPEINHILYHGVRIYDTINPDPPIFDSSIPRSFAVHATTVNAFTATASSESPPSLPFKDQNAHGVVDLMATKDVESHVPSLEENHLANELSKSPLIPAVTLISPLPGLEWDLFYNTVSTKMDVYHSAPSSFDFSNKFLLDLAKPKQWTSTRARHMEVLIHMLGARHSTHLLTEKSAFTTPLLPAYITDSCPDFAPCRKRSTFLWDERFQTLLYFNSALLA
ncbi:hypothetical protein Bca4012_087141 [Brassica carinata]